MQNKSENINRDRIYLEQVLGKDTISHINLINKSEIASLLKNDYEIEDVKYAQGWFDQKTESIYLVSDNIEATNALTREENLAWVAWHEMAHRGLRVRYGDHYNHFLEQLETHPLINQIADSIQKQLKYSREIALEEALVELSSAYKTKKWEHLEDQYDVKIDAFWKQDETQSNNGLKAFFAKIGEFLRRLISDVTQMPPNRPMTNEDVFNVIRNVHKGIQTFSQEPIKSYLHHKPEYLTPSKESENIDNKNEINNNDVNNYQTSSLDYIDSQIPFNDAPSAYYDDYDAFLASDTSSGFEPDFPFHEALSADYVLVNSEYIDNKSINNNEINNNAVNNHQTLPLDYTDSQMPFNDDPPAYYDDYDAFLASDTSSDFESNFPFHEDLSADNEKFVDNDKALNAQYEQAKASGKTELTFQQWKQVRTPEFKQMFGDWENDIENASRAINPRTGEPLVLYHGANSVFTRFDPDLRGRNTRAPSAYHGFYFTDNPDVAREYFHQKRDGLDISYQEAKYPLDFGLLKETTKNDVSYYNDTFTLDTSYENDNTQANTELKTDINVSVFEKQSDDSFSYNDEGNKVYSKELVAEISIYQQEYGAERFVYQNSDGNVEYDDWRDVNFVWQDEVFELTAETEHQLYRKINEELSKVYVQNMKLDPEHNLMEVFLNIREPIVHDYKHKKEREVPYSALTQKMVENNNDGAIFKNTYDSGRNKSIVSNIYVVRSNTAIKSATDNNGDFSPHNEDIRYSKSIQKVSNESLENPNKYRNPNYKFDKKDVRLKDSMAGKYSLYVGAAKITLEDLLDQSPLLKNYPELGKIGFQEVDKIQPINSIRHGILFNESTNTILLERNYFYLNEAASVENFLRDFLKEKVKQIQSQIKEERQHISLEEQYKIDKQNGYTQLTLKQYEQTKSKNFKAWFGNWEKNSSKSSKVVNENTNEPLVVYHGTPYRFNTFDLDRLGESGQQYGAGFYFTNDKQLAKGFFKEGGEVQQNYLNINKWLNQDRVTISYSELQEIIEEIDRQNGSSVEDGFLSNFIDVRSVGKSAAMNEAIKALRQNENDINLIDEISVLAGNNALKAIHNVLGNVGNKVKLNDSTTIYTVISPNQIKSATRNKGLFEKSNPDIRFSFAGKKAKEADQELLEKAKKDLDKGADEIRVWRETGWFKGKDKKWRFEIDDSQANIKYSDKFKSLEELQLELLSYKKGFESYDALCQRRNELSREERRILDERNRLAAQPRYKGKAADERALFTKWYNLSKEINKLYRGNLIATNDLVLSDILEHDILFKNYPELQSMPIHLSYLEEGTLGLFYSSGKISIDIDLSFEQARSVLLHEVQHAIQDIESFAKGSNSSPEAKYHVMRYLDNDIRQKELELEQFKQQHASLDQSRAIRDHLGRLKDDFISYKAVDKLKEYAHSENITRNFRHVMNNVSLVDYLVYRNLKGDLTLSDEVKENLANIQRGYYQLPSKRSQSFKSALQNFAFEAAEAIQATIVPLNLERFNVDVQNQRSHKSIQNEINKEYRQIDALVAPIEYRIAQAQTEIKELKELQSYHSYSNEYDVYHHTAGEVESRNVQTRLNMTTEERKQNFPLQTESVKKEHQIIYGVDELKGGLSQSSKHNLLFSKPITEQEKVASLDTQAAILQSSDIRKVNYNHTDLPKDINLAETKKYYKGLFVSQKETKNPTLGKVFLPKSAVEKTFEAGVSNRFFNLGLLVAKDVLEKGVVVHSENIDKNITRFAVSAPVSLNKREHIATAFVDIDARNKQGKLHSVRTDTIVCVMHSKNPNTLQTTLRNAMNHYSPEVEQYYKNKPFREIVDKIAAGREPQFPIDLGKKPEVLDLIGIKGNSINIETGVLRKIMGEYMGLKSYQHDYSHIHNLTPNNVKQLPEKLVNPVAIFKSSSMPNAIVIMVDLLEKDKKTGNNLPVVIAAHMKSHEQENFIIDIRSVYGRNVELVNEEIRTNLLYINKPKATQFLSEVGLSINDFLSNPNFHSLRIKTDVDLEKYKSKINVTNDEVLEKSKWNLDTTIPSPKDTVIVNINEKYYTEQSKSKECWQNSEEFVETRKLIREAKPLKEKFLKDLHQNFKINENKQIIVDAEQATLTKENQPKVSSENENVKKASFQQEVSNNMPFKLR